MCWFLNLKTLKFVWFVGAICDVLLNLAQSIHDNGGQLLKVYRNVLVMRLIRSVFRAYFLYFHPYIAYNHIVKRQADYHVYVITMFTETSQNRNMKCNRTSTKAELEVSLVNVLNVIFRRSNTDCSASQVR